MYSNEHYAYVYSSYINAICSTEEFLIYDCFLIKESLMSCGHEPNLHPLDIA